MAATRRSARAAAAVAVLAALILALLVYGWGPSFLPAQSDAALDACEETTGSRTVEIEWRCLPEAGWTCIDNDSNNKESNLGWWA